MEGDYTIILITYRDEDESTHKPAEEIFVTHCLRSFGFKYELIEYSYTDSTNFFGRLPVLYFNGNVITQRSLPLFIFTLLDIAEDKGMTTHFENLLYLLRDEMRFNNEYHKSKSRENEKKGFIQALMSLVFGDRPIDVIAEQAICIKEKVISSDHFVGDINMNTLSKIKKLGEVKHSNEHFNSLIDVLIYSYLTEDKSLVTEVLGKSEDWIPDANIPFPVKKDLTSVLQKYKMKFSTKRKEKKIMLQEQQITNNLFNTAISFGLFVSFVSLTYFLTKWKNRNY
jgi:hypothetical protein